MAELKMSGKRDSTGVTFEKSPVVSLLAFLGVGLK